MEKAVSAATDALRQQLGDEAADLVLVFASPHFAREIEDLPGLLASRFPGAVVLGCTAGGVIGAGHEVEERPALSLTAAKLPGVHLHPFHVDTQQFPPEEADPTAWAGLIGVPAEARPDFLLLADPFTCQPDALLAGLDRTYPAARKVGGLVSGARAPGQHRLFLGTQAWRTGAVGLGLTGNIRVETVIAQGCRTIGKPMLVTRCEQNVILELDGQSPLEVLRALHGSLDARDQGLFEHSLFLGIEMRQEQVEYNPGDLLVRNILGFDPEAGALAVGAPLRPLQAVQFLLRDARTAAEDLIWHLQRYRGEQPGAAPEGALLFSCLGRGMHLFGRPDHDTDLFQQLVGQVPLGGFFCNGEIGPVGGRTFLHGYTSAFALFREREPTGPRGAP